MSITALRTKLFAAQIKRELVELPSLDAIVEVRGLTAGARSRVLAQTQLEKPASEDGATATGGIDFEKYYPALLIETVFDPETNAPVFSVGDTEALNDLPADVVDTLAAVAQRLSGLGTAAKALEKNSDAIPSDATASA